MDRLGRDACTVAALRSRVDEIDLDAPKVDAGRAPVAGKEAITYGDMKKRMASVLSGGVDG